MEEAPPLPSNERSCLFHPRVPSAPGKAPTESRECCSRLGAQCGAAVCSAAQRGQREMSGPTSYLVSRSICSFPTSISFPHSLHGSRTLCHLGTNYNISCPFLSPRLAQTLLFTETEQR